jgi:uncharacterized protein YdaU (DUF1376 family)
MPGAKLIWMPFYISDFLTDTTELNVILSGAYHLLLSWEFLHGPLPEDPEFLCNISKLSTLKSVDAWSIAQASPKHMLDVLLQRYFTQLPDKTWVQKRVEIERAKVLEKMTVNSEKARKAANARWNRQRRLKEEQAKINDAPSIAQALPEQSSGLLQSQVSTKAKAIGSLRSPLPNGAAAPRGGSPNQPSPDGKSSPGNPTGPKQSKTKAKPPKTGPGCIAKGRNDGKGQDVSESRATLKLGGKDGHSRKRLHPPKADFPADSRWEPCHAELSEFWKVSNRDSETAGELPWEARDRAALLRLLQACPEMTREMLRVWLVNRAHSEGIVFTDPPRNWVSVNLKRYADGPLDRYNKPIKGRRGY